MFLHLTEADYLEDYKLKVKFNNGAEGIVDLEKELYGEVFETLKDKKLFQDFTLTGRTIEWSTGADFAPEYLYEIAEITVKPSVDVGRKLVTA